jgi:hypothetical protein
MTKYNYYYEARNVRFSNIKSICNLFKNDKKIFYSSGSFGDHAITASFLAGVPGEVNIICPQRFIAFYQLFSKEFNLIPSDGQIGNAIESYLINESSWLYDETFKIIPTLPVFYPHVPYLIDLNFGLLHENFVKYLLNLPLEHLIKAPAFLNEAVEYLKSNASWATKEGFVLICPEQHTVKEIDEPFWANLINSLHSRFGDRVLVNASPAYLNQLAINSSVRTVSLKPEEAFAAVQLASISIFSPSGFYHFSKYFCHDKNICIISDWREGETVSFKTGKAKFPSVRQESISSQPSRCKLQIVRITSQDEIESCIPKIQAYVENCVNEI